MPESSIQRNPHLAEAITGFLLALLLCNDIAEAAPPSSPASPSTLSSSPAPERIAWRKTPVSIVLTVGTERLVHFPGAVQVGVPPQLQGVLRIQSIAGTAYLLAHQPFASTRVLVRSLEDGQVYLLDLSAESDVPADADASAGSASTVTAPIEIYLQDQAIDPGQSRSESTKTAPIGYVAFTRFAAQQLYAPARLLKEPSGIVRAPVNRSPVALVRGNAIEAAPLIAWRAGDLYLTAVKLMNRTDESQMLDARTLHGRWLTATFQHNRLHAAGSQADQTVVYLISARPFATSLR